MKTILCFVFCLGLFHGLAQKQAGIVPSFTATDTLYPPTSLQADNMECVLYVHWSKPVLPGGGTPPGLLG